MIPDAVYYIAKGSQNVWTALLYERTRLPEKYPPLRCGPCTILSSRFDRYRRELLGQHYLQRELILGTHAMLRTGIREAEEERTFWKLYTLRMDLSC